MVCRLAMCDQNTPYVVPLCFGYKNKVFYFHSAKQGRKLDVLNANPNVCVEVETDITLNPGDKPCNWGMGFDSVIAFGTARQVSDPEEKRKSLDTIMDHYGNGPWTYSDKALAATKTAKLPKLFWSWEEMVGPNKEGFFPYTPGTNLLHGLAEAIDTLHEAGRDVDQELVGYGDYSDTSGAAVMRTLLERAPDLDAVFVNSDLMAIAAMGVIREEGCCVPNDVAVVGYDDLSIAAHSNPPLTTVRQNVPEAGRLLARNLVEYLQTGMVANVTVPVELVVRQSG